MKLQKWISLLLCICMMLGVYASAEEAAATTEPASEAADTLTEGAGAATTGDFADDELMATVNGEAVTWADVKEYYNSMLSYFGSYYDITDPANVNLFRAYALETVIKEVLLKQEAVKDGLDKAQDADKDELIAKADAEWQELLDNYIAEYFTNLTEESSEEEKAQAKAGAEEYFLSMGYDQEIYRKTYLEYDLTDRVYALVTQDVVVTDADLEADYQAKVATDQELYENNIGGYIDYNSYVDQMALYAMMYGTENEMDYAWYKPAGFRAVKHILLPVDDELMAAYKNLQASLEEQMNVEEQEDTAALEDASPEAAATGEAEATDAVASDTPEATSEAEATDAATPEPTQVPVTQADVDNAKADVLAALADKIDEINQKISEGVDFDELIATYGVKEDGTPTDSNMTYEVAVESTNYMPEFVEAAFSVSNIGDVSAPYLSDYGVHIVKYIADVPAGPIEMTAEEREARRTSLLTEKKNEVYYAQLDAWMAEADIVYSGLVPSMKQLEAVQEAEVEENEEMVAEGMEAVEDVVENTEDTTAETTAEPATAE